MTQNNNPNNNPAGNSPQPLPPTNSTKPADASSDLKLPDIEKPLDKVKLGSTIEETPQKPQVQEPTPVSTSQPSTTPQPQPVPKTNPNPAVIDTAKTDSNQILDSTPKLDLATHPEEKPTAQPLPPTMSTPPVSPPVTPPNMTSPASPPVESPTTSLVAPQNTNPVPPPTTPNSPNQPNATTTPNPSPNMTSPSLATPAQPEIKPPGSPVIVEQATIQEPTEVSEKTSIAKKIGIAVVLIALSVSAAGAAWFAMKTFGSQPETLNTVPNRRSASTGASTSSAIPEEESTTDQVNVSDLPELFIDFYQITQTTPPETWISLDQANLFSIKYPQEWSLQTETLTAEDGATKEIHRLTLTNPEDTDFSDNNYIQFETVSQNHPRAQVGQDNVNQSVGQIGEQDIWITSTATDQTPMITYIIPVASEQIILVDLQVNDTASWADQQGMFKSVLGSFELVE